MSKSTFFLVWSFFLYVLGWGSGLEFLQIGLVGRRLGWGRDVFIRDVRDLLTFLTIRDSYFIFFFWAGWNGSMLLRVIEIGIGTRTEHVSSFWDPVLFVRD